jgi:hypothetical protein
MEAIPRRSFLVAALLVGVILFPGGTTYAQPPCTPSLLAPLQDAEVDNGNSARDDVNVWDFDWSHCIGATLYEVLVQHAGAQFPVVSAIVTSSFYHYECDGCYVADVNRFDWIWRVRAYENGLWGEWSETRRFSVEPLNTDPTPVCEIELNQEAFVDGDPVIVRDLRVANANHGRGSVMIEAKLSIVAPGSQLLPLFNVGADGSFAVPPGFDQNFGPIHLAMVQTSHPRGRYQIVCRLVHAVTGALLSEDLRPFEIR